MTKTEKRIFLNAAKDMKRRSEFSCNAIGTHDPIGLYKSKSVGLAHKYARFYNRYSEDRGNQTHYWGQEITQMFSDSAREDRQNFRVMLLLWYREVGWKGIKKGKIKRKIQK